MKPPKKDLPETIALRLNGFAIKLRQKVRARRLAQYEAHIQALAKSRDRGYLNVEDAFNRLRRAIERDIPSGAERRWVLDPLGAWWRDVYQ
jgi:hypothetical protein